MNTIRTIITVTSLQLRRIGRRVNFLSNDKKLVSRRNAQSLGDQSFSEDKASHSVPNARFQNLISPVLRGLIHGTAIAVGFLGSTLLAVAVTGNIKTWTTGETLTSTDLNTTITSMKTAIESIPNWTKASNGNDAFYTAGYIGIGTASPTQTLHLHNNTQPVLQLTSASGLFQMGANNTDTWIYSGTNPMEFSTNSAERMRITAAGNVGIGTTSPSALLHVAGTAGNNTGTWSNLSDVKLKKNIQDYDGSLEKVLKLRPVSFEWKETKEGRSGGKHIGFIAQEVEKVFPEWVAPHTDGNKWLTPEGINAVLVDAIQELKSFYDKENLESKKRISELKSENDKLSSRYASLLDDRALLKQENTELKKRLDRIESTLAVIERQSNEKMAALPAKR